MNLKNYSQNHQLRTTHTTKYRQEPETCTYTHNDCGHIFANAGLFANAGCQTSGQVVIFQYYFLILILGQLE